MEPTYIVISFHVFKELFEQLHREDHILGPEVSHGDERGRDQVNQVLVLLNVNVPAH